MQEHGNMGTWESDLQQLDDGKRSPNRAVLACVVERSVAREVRNISLRGKKKKKKKMTVELLLKDTSEIRTPL